MTTLSDLLDMWSSRDGKYIHRRINGISAPLSESEIDSIRFYRKSEIEMLPLNDRRLAIMALDRWMPPITVR